MPPKFTPTPESSEPKRFTVGMRVGKAARERLEKAAAKSGRSLSQEAELRLERSFDQQANALDALTLKYGDRFAKILIAAADAGQYAGRGYGAMVAKDRGDGIENWTEYPTAYQRAVETMAEVFKTTRPPGGQKELPATDWKSPSDIAAAIVTQHHLVIAKIRTIQGDAADMQEINQRIKEMQSQLDEMKKSVEVMSAGHIRRRGEKSWELKFDTGIDASGKRQIRYHSFKGTKREAQAELTRLVASTNAGTYVDPDNTTLGEFLTRWERDWAQGNVSAKTSERWRQLIAFQVIPRVGQLPIQRVKAAHLQELYGALLKAGSADGKPLAPRTVGHVHRMLRRAFGHAVTWGILATNPVAVVSAPRVPDSEIEIVSDAEIRRVLDHLRRRDRQLHTIAFLALGTGMRRGELLALRWRDVGDDKIKVERSLEQTRAGLRFKSPKTKRSRRLRKYPTRGVGGTSRL